MHEPGHRNTLRIQKLRQVEEINTEKLNNSYLDHKKQDIREFKIKMWGRNQESCTGKF